VKISLEATARLVPRHRKDTGQLKPLRPEVANDLVGQRLPRIELRKRALDQDFVNQMDDALGALKYL
jgi:hypothetical protein